MKIEKSTRHHKIIGDFGEALVCNWFSRSGFEVTLIDHTGIDIVAYNPKTKQRLGISVKSRARVEGKEHTSVNLFKNRKNERLRLDAACEAFACEAWIAVYAESTDSADLYVVSVEHYDNQYRGPGGRAIDDWKMGGEAMKGYATDPRVRHVHMKFDDRGWAWNNARIR